MDPRVGSGRVTILRILVGRVGSGHHFADFGGSGRVSTSDLLVFYLLFLAISWYLNRHDSLNTTLGLIVFHRYLIYNNYLVIK